MSSSSHRTKWISLSVKTCTSTHSLKTPLPLIHPPKVLSLSHHLCFLLHNFFQSVEFKVWCSQLDHVILAVAACGRWLLFCVTSGHWPSWYGPGMTSQPSVLRTAVWTVYNRWAGFSSLVHVSVRKGVFCRCVFFICCSIYIVSICYLAFEIYFTRRLQSDSNYWNLIYDLEYTPGEVFLVTKGIGWHSFLRVFNSLLIRFI